MYAFLNVCTTAVFFRNLLFPFSLEMENDGNMKQVVKGSVVAPLGAGKNKRGLCCCVLLSGPQKYLTNNIIHNNNAIHIYDDDDDHDHFADSKIKYIYCHAMSEKISRYIISNSKREKSRAAGKNVC